ncbi:uncharacterized protein FOMMEDRAFT_130851 [Fomitiporia mediterranea MF3/22]|uniref:uncharacterized protein n=1 Tax=Fomitiporia mediterranea (strain MF3/22) TaxID=694068 RepID=UPI000440911B|nr:uncharacterized protein FOMMEDRAFT_130851 [Fomitiporia mediterranea MF3/22]EJD07756.1 hypothetical protein FOMMEDRAFT_130851 [Fomitiporia mediterranea MF3/22]
MFLDYSTLDAACFQLPDKSLRRVFLLSLHLQVVVDAEVEPIIVNHIFRLSGTLVSYSPREV